MFRAKPVEPAAAVDADGRRARGGGARTFGLFAAAWLVAMASLVGGAFAAQPPVGLGTAESYAVLAGQAVTNTGSSTINGDVGLSPGTSITGFSSVTVNGTIHQTDAAAAQAQSDLTTAYNDAAGRIPAVVLASEELGGLTLTAGVYKSASSLGLTGTLTLDAQGNPDAVFIFQAPSSTLITASESHVSLINGAQPCNVFWQVGSSATLGTSSAFAGNIMALTTISMNNGVTLNGRALARNGEVTLIGDTITAAHCAAVAPPAVAPPVVAPPPAAQNGTAHLTTVPPSVAKTVARFGTSRCVSGKFRAVVTGLFIRQVVFSLGVHVISSRTKSPFEALVAAGNGIHTVSARVTFTDSTPAVTLSLRFKACAAAKRAVHRHPPPSPSRPERSPSGFTG